MTAVVDLAAVVVPRRSSQIDSSLEPFEPRRRPGNVVERATEQDDDPAEVQPDDEQEECPEHPEGGVSAGHLCVVDEGDLQGEGEVTEVSARLLVDGETGLVTETRYRLKRVSEDGRSVTVENKRVLSDLGATSVPTPAWLSEARQRTTPNSTLVFEPIAEPIVVNRTVNIS